MTAHATRVAPLRTVLLLCLAIAVGGSGPAAAGAVAAGGQAAPAAMPQAQGPEADPETSWSMLAANPGRTSWVAEEVRGALHPVWYRPLEPYINPKIQVIAAYGLLYISTANGLYAFRADTGAVAWVYPTDMPLGHSPTVAGNTLYVGGYDRLIHAIEANPDVAGLPTRDGVRINDRVRWTFAAGAGFETNPLVVDGRLYAGNRDGYLYALDANTGALLWKYATGGPLSCSAAYRDGTIYFASNDGYAYALTTAGGLVWKSQKLLGAGFHSYWPVIYKDYVVFAGSSAYGFTTGLSVGYLNNLLDKDAVYPSGSVRGTWLGPLGTEPGDWVAGTVTIDASAAAQYYEQMPWRRTYFVLSRATGAEFTMDTDSDGLPEYAPILWAHTHSGNRYPAIVGGDGVLYQQQDYRYDPYIPGGQVSGWKFGTQFISRVSSDWQAVDEPESYSAGGNLLYWSGCNDREGGSVDLTSPVGAPDHERKYFDYNLPTLIPGYDVMYYEPPAGQTGTDGVFGGPNGIYTPGGVQSPLVPYRGRLYKVLGNALVAFGPTGSTVSLQIVAAVSAAPSGPTLGREAVRQRLASEISAMVAAGHLRPGYHNSGLQDYILGHDSNSYLAHYFHNPGETFYTLIRALPYLPADLRAQARTYLQQEYADYGRLVHIGWQEGAAREAFTLPPEVEAKMDAFAPLASIYGSSWDYRYGVYGLWKYAQEFGGAAAIFARVKGKMPIVDPTRDSIYATEEPPLSIRLYLPLILRTGSTARGGPGLTVDLFAPEAAPGTYAYHPYIHNAYIAGYLGYLGLQTMAGEPESAEIRTELNRLLGLRAATFSKDSPYSGYYTGHVTLNVARNFLYMVPELGDYLHAHAYGLVAQAVAEYDRITPYWFVPGYDQGYKEGAIHHLFDANAMFQAKAQILQEPYAELAKYLDVPGFATGDLYYIQSLVSLLEASD
ncbi:MAG: PQQ-like beta-propeller repeat protein [Chloroflexi bacterium]|nr:PQQ-like beta-propeller repeat protein [Chloroflexota bacterium]